MPQFQHDQIAFGDLPGYGAYDIGHAREHLQFVQVLAAKTPAVLIPDFNFLHFLTAGQAWEMMTSGHLLSARQSIMQTHYQAHLLLRAQLGILGGVDLSSFNLDDAGDFYSFLSFHSQEHAQIRQNLGIL